METDTNSEPTSWSSSAISPAPSIGSASPFRPLSPPLSDLASDIMREQSPSDPQLAMTNSPYHPHFGYAACACSCQELRCPRMPQIASGHVLFRPLGSASGVSLPVESVYASASSFPCGHQSSHLATVAVPPATQFSDDNPVVDIRFRDFQVSRERLEKTRAKLQNVVDWILTANVALPAHLYPTTL
eukprot:EG_transcript_2301